MGVGHDSARLRPRIVAVIPLVRTPEALVRKRWLVGVRKRWLVGVRGSAHRPPVGYRGWPSKNAPDGLKRRALVRRGRNPSLERRMRWAARWQARTRSRSRPLPVQGKAGVLRLTPLLSLPPCGFLNLTPSAPPVKAQVRPLSGRPHTTGLFSLLCPT